MKRLTPIFAVVLFVSAARASVSVGYWNFNNMELSAPPTDFASPTPSSPPGPTGLVCTSTVGNYRFEYGSPSFPVPAPGGQNALNNDPDVYGLRVGNGDANNIRNGGAVFFPLASMQGLQGLEASFAIYGGGFQTVRVLWNTQSTNAPVGEWNLISTFSPSGAWQTRQFNFGAVLDGVSNPVVAIQFDNGGQYAWTVLDNVQFTASPVPAPGAAAFIMLLTGPLTQRRRATSYASAP